jgi:hypothetical protein
VRTIKVKDLMAISGKGGLFRFLAQARNGVVVESLSDKKRTVAPTTARVSALEDISIFGKEEDIPLADVMMKIHEKENGGPAIDTKSGNEALKAYFIEVFPGYDPDRVYVSDIKKVITWYNQLHEQQLLEVIEKEEKAEDVSGPAEESEEKGPDKHADKEVKD